jgi:hypothetical protein
MTYADWIRLASRSFPRRWCAERGQELFQTTLDLAPADARRPSVRILFDLMVSGISERRRTRPPLWRWLYYSLGGKLPLQWHPWMRDDLTGRWFWFRDSLRRTWLVALFYGLMQMAFVVFASRTIPWTAKAPFVLTYFPFTFLLGVFTARRNRRRFWERHGYVEDGTWARPIPYVSWPSQPRVLPPSFPIGPSFRFFGIVLVAASGCWFYGAAYPHESFRVFGLRTYHDPNSPMTRKAVAILAAVTSLSVLFIGPLVTRILERKPLRDRLPLGPSAGRNRRNLQLGLLGLATLITAPAMTGVLPSMATAGVGAACLVVGGSSLVIAAFHRHPSLTWDDLTRSRKDPTGCTAGRLDNQAA